MKRMILCGLVLVALALVLQACDIYETTATNAATSAPAGQGNVSGATTHSIVGKSSLSASFIDQVLGSAGSPARGLGAQFVKLSEKTSIDAAYVLAIFHHESGYGLTGEARASRSPGNMRCLDLAHYGDTGTWCQCEQPGNCYAWFPSWYAGLVATFRLLAGPLYAAGGRTTIEQVIKRWAPAGDHNDDTAYIHAVLQDVSTWRAAQ